MDVFIDNQSKHPFQCRDCWGRGLSCEERMVIPAGSKVRIGAIESSGLPSMAAWGWWTIQDRLNMAVFECFADLAASSGIRPIIDAGLKTNAVHDKYLPKGPTPQRVPEYVRPEPATGSSVTFTIDANWTRNPPDYIFNYGHYCCFPHKPLPELAAHAYLIVRSFDGSEKIDFNCYGSVTPDYHPEEWIDAAGTYLGTRQQLRLARTICCFDPDDRRSVYNLKPITSNGIIRPVGPLKLGDCSGIIFGLSGVCQNMANRICAAVTDLDAGAMAAMPAYDLTRLIWGTYGSPSSAPGPEWGRESIREYFVQVHTFEANIGSLGIKPDAPYPISLLFRPWEEYIAECRKMAGIR